MARSRCWTGWKYWYYDCHTSNISRQVSFMFRNEIVTNMLKLCRKVWFLDCFQRHPSTSPEPYPIHAASYSLPSRSLHSRYDGQHCLCRRHSQAREISLPWSSTSSWCSHRCSFRSCSTRSSNYSNSNSVIHRESLALWRISCLWGFHPL